MKNSVAIMPRLSSLPTSARSGSRIQAFTTGRPDTMSPVASTRAPGSFFESSQCSINTDKALARERVARSTSVTRSSIRDGWRVVIGRALRAFEMAQLHRTGRDIRPGTCSQNICVNGERIGAGAANSRDGTVEALGGPVRPYYQSRGFTLAEWEAQRLYSAFLTPTRINSVAAMPVSVEQGRVQLAHPSGPTKCERIHSPWRFGLSSTLSPSNGVSVLTDCPRTKTIRPLIAQV
jgi:hypothetical protein